MSDNSTFLEDLKIGLNLKGEELNLIVMPPMQTNFKIMFSSFVSITNILQKKGLLQKDPYEGESHITKMELPSVKAPNESRLAIELSERFSQYVHQLDYIYTSLSFDIFQMQPSQLKKLSDFASYINWDTLSDVSTEVNTRHISVLINKAKKNPGEMTTGLISGAIKDTAESASKLKILLKQAMAFSKEYYKYELRRDLNKPNLFSSDLDSVKNEFSKKYGRKRSFYTALVKDIIAEDDTEKGNVLKEKLLNSLSPADTVVKNKPVITSVNIRKELKTGIKEMINTRFTIKTIMEKISYNHNLYQEIKKTWFSSISSWFYKNFQGKKKPIIYDVVFMDKTNSERKTGKVDYLEMNRFLSQKIRLFNSLSKKDSPHQKQLQASKDDQLLKLMDSNLKEFKRIHKNLTALNIFFKVEVPEPDKRKVRSIQLELEALRTTMVQMNQIKFTAQTQKEESKRINKLGLSE